MIRSLVERRPSPSMIVAALALTAALGGTSYAAIKLPANSVGTKQLKSDAVTGAKVRDSSLSASDFAAGQLPKGPAGPKGDKGDKGDPGTPGAGASLAAIVVRYGPTVTVPPAGPTIRDGFANCHAGEKAVGGGAKMTDDPADPPLPNNSATWDTFVIDSDPTTGQTSFPPTAPANGSAAVGWHVEAHNTSVAGAHKNAIMNPYVLCAGA